MGDSQSKQEFSQLLQGCERELLQYILTLMPNYADALDVLQETACALWRKHGEYDPTQPFERWARKFAYMQVLRLRKTMRQRDWKLIKMNDEILEILSAEYELHSDVIDLRYQALRKCMETLSREDFSVVSARYWHDTKLRDVAATRGVAVKQVYQQMERIRRRLQKCIEVKIAEENT